MLTGLKLTNCRQHKSTTLTFVPGVNTIVGPNNSGKSTIPEMIEFALYGSKALRDSAKGFITDGETNGSAIVQLKMAGDRFQIGRDTKDAKVLKNGEETAGYRSNVTRYITAFTGVSHTGFRLAHYVRQKELAAFSQLRAGKRQETIERMLRVNAVDRVLQKIKAELDAAKVVYDGLLAQVSDVEAEENELSDLLLQREATQQHPHDTAPLEEELGRIREAVASCDRELAEIAAAVRRRTQLQKEITAAEEQLKQKPALLEQLDQADKSLAAIGLASDEHLNELRHRLAALGQLQLKHAQMEGLRQELAKELAEVARPICPDATARNTAAADLAAARSAARGFRSLNGACTCPTCQQGVSGHGEIQAQLDARVATLAEAHATLDSAYSLAMAEYTTQSDAFSRYSAAVERRAEIASKIEDVQFDAAEKTQLEAELEQCRQDRESRVRWEGEKRRLEQSLSVLQEKETWLSSATTELSSLKSEDPQVGARRHALVADLADAEAEYKQVIEAETSRREALATVNGRILELQGIVDKAYQLKEATFRAAEEVAVHQGRQAKFNKFKKYMTAKIRPMLQEVAETLFHKVTKNRYASFQLGSDYDLMLTTHKGFIRKLDTVSGSENDLANLCLRLAIATLRANKLAGSLGFIILDEICSSFDDRRTKQTLEGLLELRDVIPQIINITHKPVEMRYADKLFSVEEIGGIAKVTATP